MINNKKTNSIVFVSRYLSQTNYKNKKFYRKLSMLQNRFYLFLPCASKIEKSNQDNEVANSTLPFSRLDEVSYYSKKYKVHSLLNKKYSALSLVNKPSLAVQKTPLKAELVFRKQTNSDSFFKNKNAESKLGGEFFPSKKAFIHYWTLPFVGFAGYVYLTKLRLSSSAQPLLQVNPLISFSMEQGNLNVKGISTLMETKENIFSPVYKIKKQYNPLILSNHKQDSFNSSIVRIEKEESQASFFVTNFLFKTRNQSNLERVFPLFAKQNHSIFQKRSELVRTSEIPQKLLPLNNKIQVDNSFGSSFTLKNTKTVMQKDCNNESVVFAQKQPINNYTAAAELFDNFFKNSKLFSALFSLSLEDKSQNANFVSSCFCSAVGNNIGYKNQILNSDLVNKMNQILEISKMDQNRVKQCVYLSDSSRFCFAGLESLKKLSLSYNYNSNDKPKGPKGTNEKTQHSLLPLLSMRVVKQSEPENSLQPKQRNQKLHYNLEKAKTSKFYMFENQKTDLDMKSSPLSSLIFIKQRGTLSSRFQNLFLTKYLLNKTFSTFPVFGFSSFDAYLVHANPEIKTNLQFATEKPSLSSYMIPYSSIFELRTKVNRLTKKQLNYKIQKFLITLNKIQTRSNLEFINTYTKSLKSSLDSTNMLFLQNSTSTEKTSEFESNKSTMLVDSKKNLKSLKWNLYELATLKFLKNVIDSNVELGLDSKLSLINLSPTETFSLRKTKSKNHSKNNIEYTKLKSILKNFYNQKSHHKTISFLGKSLSSSQTNKILCHKLIPTCFSVLIDDELAAKQLPSFPLLESQNVLKDLSLLNFDMMPAEVNVQSVFDTVKRQNEMTTKKSEANSNTPYSLLPILNSSTQNPLFLTSDVYAKNLKFFEWVKVNEIGNLDQIFLLCRTKFFLIFRNYNHNFLNLNLKFNNKAFNLSNHSQSNVYLSDLSFNSNKQFVSSLDSSPQHRQKLKQSYFLRYKSKKHLKFKNNLLLKTLTNRKQEKIFRTYLSNKFTDNNTKLYLLSNQSYLKKILKIVKNRLPRTNLSFSKSENYNTAVPILACHAYAPQKMLFCSNKIEMTNQFLRNKNQIENQDLSNLSYPADQQRYSTHTLLRRIGFLFKYKGELANKETVNRLEKQRSQQKKRRRKKQKRFYPRPVWLRFLLYRNFLTYRHVSLNKLDSFTKKELIKKPLSTSYFANSSDLTYNGKPSFYRKSLARYYDSKKQWTNEKFLSKIFRNNKKYQETVKTQLAVLTSPFIDTNFVSSFSKGQILNLEKTSLYNASMAYCSATGLNREQANSLFSLQEKDTQKYNMFHNQEYYQISNEVMSDFQRLCWKSYWLRSSLTPYIHRIQNSMQKMRNVETKQFVPSNKFSLNFLLPQEKETQTVWRTTEQSLKRAESKLNDLSENKDSSTLNFYLNFKNSFQSNSDISNFGTFQMLQNRSEYERILYNRISDIIENVKANLDGNGQSRAKTFKVGRSRKDNYNLRRPFSMSSNQSGTGKTSSRNLNRLQEDSFFSRFGLFINNSLNIPNIRAFSLESAMDSSMKPFGDLPTLRSFWALNRTNTLVTFAQAKTNAGQPEKPIIKQLTQTKNLWSVLKLREQNASNKTKKFFSMVWKKLVLTPFTYQGLNNLEKTSLQKLEVANKKLNYLGVHLKSNKSILKTLKTKLKNKNKSFRFVVQSQTTTGWEAKEQQQDLNFLLSTTKENLQAQKQAKRSIHFWWSFPEFTKGFHTFPFHTRPDTFSVFTTSQPQNNSILINSQMILTTLWGCTLLFHICSLFSIIQISEIRSLAKFYVLILYKFSNVYLILVYSIFNLLKNYFKQFIYVLSFFTKLKKTSVPFNTLNRNNKSFFTKSISMSNNNQTLKPFSLLSANSYFVPQNSRDIYTTGELLDSKQFLKESQTFFYGSFDKVQIDKTVKDSFFKFKVLNLLETTENTKNSFSPLEKNQTAKQTAKQMDSFAFKRNFENLKIRFHANFLVDTKKFSKFVTKSYNQFSILEMCFYSPNMKIQFFSNLPDVSSFASLTTKQSEQRPDKAYYSTFLTPSPTEQEQESKKRFFNLQKTQKLNDEFLLKTNKQTVFETRKNFVFSSSRNLKQFISSIVFISQKQILATRFYMAKNFQLTQKTISFMFNKSFHQFYSTLWVGCLLMTKASLSLMYNGLGFISLILFKIIDILESLMMLIYKFLEKPAEFMIEWIAQLFLVEWASDITTYIPESFDIYTWRSFNKLSRGSRIFFVFGFLMQRRLWCLFDIFSNLLTKPDSDLLNRQKKGMIFWDVWAEILMTAAEKYRINLSSLTTVREEQEAFLERLLNDPNWLSSWQSSSFTEQSDVNKSNILYETKRINKIQQSNFKIAKQTRALAELELLSTAGNRPESWLGRQSFFYKEAYNQRNALWPLKSNNNFDLSNITGQPKKSFNVQQLMGLKRKLSSTYSLNFINNEFYVKGNETSNISESFYSFDERKTLNKQLPSFTAQKESVYFASDFRSNWIIWQRWSTNQHFTNQGTDTDLFIDVHPPKSFTHLSQLKSSHSGISGGIAGLPTLGSLTCQIYSGLFSKQVSKNILVVGSRCGASGNSQSQLIQALAGETELKMIADNAHRYAHIQRGIAVGMKLLRDVFDGLALHTPCLFLMEDIHVIGERRPMLISDNENAKAAEYSFFSENEEVHEKNQFIYQLNKHAISDFRKPYKGDFSLLIPTNHFCFDLFLGVSPPKIRKNGKTTRSPFALETKFYETQKDGNAGDQEKTPTTLMLKSLLQRPTTQFFAPPATSPFTILGMKEQRQFKAMQVVKQIPWGGFSNDQIMLLPKVTYSIRVKIALLADLAMNQLSVKLDMITDLLVIMDNVRSNRGFVVFATTHVPFVLDPALRRPGRLDETISLPFAPTLIDRFEILKASFSNYTSTLDFMSYSFLLQNYNQTDLSNLISRTKLLLFNNPIPFSSKLISSDNYKTTRKYKLGQTNIYSLNMALSLMTQMEITEPQKMYQHVKKAYKKISSIQKANVLNTNSLTFSKNSNKTILELLKISKTRSPLSSVASSLVAVTYSQIGKFMVGSQILSDTRSFRTIVPFFEESTQEGEDTIFRNLYSSSLDIQNVLMYLLSGKAGEFFFFSQFNLLKNLKQLTNANQSSQDSIHTFSLKPSLTNPELNTSLWNVSTSLSNSASNQLFTFSNSQNGTGEEFWSSATSFVFALVQKRYLYNKTLLTNRLLYFNDISMLREPPSPPGSAILMTAKKYENLKRTERDFQQKPVYSILEKIRLHQQQRFMKKLYEKSVIDVFRSEMVNDRYTSFNTSVKELGYYNSFMRKPTSVTSFYTNRILTRHKFSFVNQWWNGQLAEHNLESTFSSDVDWRSMFVESFGDLVIDFPDADQHYNPKLRRWFLQSTYGGYWNTFEKNIPFEVYQHYIIMCFNKTVNYLHTEREVLDSLAYTYLRKSTFKEVDFISNLSRFNIF